MAFSFRIREDKLRAAMLKLEKFSRDPLQRRRLGVKRSYERRRRGYEQKLMSAEQLEGLFEKRLADIKLLRETAGREARLPCSRCGRSVLFDLDSVIYLSELFRVNPDELLLCPACRSQRGVKRRIKTGAKKGGVTVM